MSQSLPRPADQPESQTSDARVDAGVCGRQRGALDDLLLLAEQAPTLFSARSLREELIAAVLGHPDVSVLFAVDRTVVTIRRQDFWVFGTRCPHCFGHFVSEREALTVACPACLDIHAAEQRSERWAGQFIDTVRHAASVEPDRLSTTVRNFERG